MLILIFLIQSAFAIESLPEFECIIHHDGNTLEFGLVGNPPSRNGYLKLLKNAPIVSEILAKITCH